jgi:hypothetical protein
MICLSARDLSGSGAREGKTPVDPGSRVVTLIAACIDRYHYECPQ